MKIGRKTPAWVAKARSAVCSGKVFDEITSARIARACLKHYQSPVYSLYKLYAQSEFCNLHFSDSCLGLQKLSFLEDKVGIKEIVEYCLKSVLNKPKYSNNYKLVDLDKERVFCYNIKLF